MDNREKELLFEIFELYIDGAAPKINAFRLAHDVDDLDKLDRLVNMQYLDSRDDYYRIKPLRILTLDHPLVKSEKTMVNCILPRLLEMFLSKSESPTFTRPDVKTGNPKCGHLTEADISRALIYLHELNVLEIYGRDGNNLAMSFTLRESIRKAKSIDAIIPDWARPEDLAKAELARQNESARISFGSLLGPQPKTETQGKSIYQHPWFQGIATNAIGGIISAAVIGGIAIYKLQTPRTKLPDKPDQPLSRNLPTSHTRPTSITTSHASPPAATMADGAAQSKMEKNEHFRAIQHIDRSIEDGQAALIDVQRVFQKQFDAGKSAAAARGLSGSSVEQSLLYVAQQTGHTKIGDIETKIRREIEDQLVQYSMTALEMSQSSWLQPQATAYADFRRQLEIAKKGMTSAIRK